MRKSKFSETQIVSILKDAEGGSAYTGVPPGARTETSAPD